jgi:hypothetical protein
MSVDQPDVVDIISTSKSGEIVLSISDHLDWTDTHGHLLVLQEKINRYLSFLESGEVYQRYPDASGRKMTIKVVFHMEPNLEANSFLAKARIIVEGAGFEFELFSASPYPI